MKKNDVTSSISFVINAIYTFTFGNTALIVLADPNSGGFSLEAIALDGETAICGLVALTLTIRYFFGNNVFISEVFADSSKNEYVRLFHFGTVAAQSVMLLVASFEVRDAEQFFLIVASLFLLEAMWFVVCHFIDGDSVAGKNRIAPLEDWIFQSFGVALAAITIWFYTSSSNFNGTEIAIIAFLFACDTLEDLRENLKGYMGVDDQV